MQSASLLVRVLLGAWLLATIALAPSCSDLSNGTYSGGGMVYPTVISEPRPVIEITTPARGAFLVPGPVAIEGRVFAARPDQPTPTALEVDGAVVPVDPDGRFRTLGTVIAGLNIIRANVIDANARTGFAAVGVLAGEYAPRSAPIANALGLRVNDAGLLGATKIVEDFVATYDFRSLAAQQIYTTRVLGFAQIDAYLDGLALGPAAVSLDAEPDGIHLRVQIDTPVIDLSAVIDLGGGPFPPETASIVCDRIVVTARARPVIDATGRLELVLDQPNVDLANMRTRSASPVLSFVDGLLHGLVRTLVEDQVQKLIAQQKIPVDPFEMDIVTTKIAVDLRGRAVRFDATGMEVMVDVDCTPASGVTYTARALATPGSLKTTGAPPPMRANHGMHVTLNDDALNRIAYGIWAAGGLTVDVDAFQRLQAPTGAAAVPFLLARDLKQVLPELNQIVPDTAPVNILIDAVLPPIFRAGPAPDLLELGLGELQATLLVDRGFGWEPVLKAAVHIRASIGASLDQQGLKLACNANPVVLFDVLEKPMIEIDDRRIETLIGLVATPAIPFFVKSIQVQVPYLSALSVAQVASFPDGPGADFASILADLHR